MTIEVAKLTAMLQAEVEMAASWKSLGPKEKQAYLKAHPYSRLREGGTHGTEGVNYHAHLTKHGWTKSGKNSYSHKNGKKITFKPSSDGHRHVFTVTHKNGDVTSHRTNRNTRVASLIRNYAKPPKGAVKKVVAPAKKVPVKVAPKKVTVPAKLPVKVAPKKVASAPAPVEKPSNVARRRAAMMSGRKKSKVVKPVPAAAPAAKPKAVPKAAKISNREAEW